MTLDGAIKHAEEVAEWHKWLKDNCLEEEGCEQRAEEHWQLAEWLRELKHLRNLVNYSRHFHCTIEEAEKELRIVNEQIRCWIPINERLPEDSGNLKGKNNGIR